jgi:hypothetical protein
LVIASLVLAIAMEVHKGGTMNHNDERDYAEGEFNRRFMEEEQERERESSRWTPEGVIWVCVDCMLTEANGETTENPDREPWNLWKQDDAEITMGMVREEHTDGCSFDDDCGCDQIPFSSSDCEGCGSQLAGERHAFTWWKAPS